MNTRTDISGSADKSFADIFATASNRIVLSDGTKAPDGLLIETKSHRGIFSSLLRNGSGRRVSVQEVVIADFAHGFTGDSSIYGEGFSMFCSTAGTLDDMVDLDELTDVKHYRLPQPEGFRTVYNYLRITPPGGKTILAGFTSCRRFTCKFNVNSSRIQIVQVTEGLELAPGQSWELEELMISEDADMHRLMDRFAGRIEHNHPRMKWKEVPTGWCSWYCYGPNISTGKITSNLAAFKKEMPSIRYIQIDDGYQTWMGDWLDSTDKFEGGVRRIISEIRDNGFEPAIWVAPFIASPQSNLFKSHPDWFVTDENGKPLSSGDVTFGGWRQEPWYMLDGTHPGAQDYLEEVFRTMNSWGCTYFKLDANAWGALPFGRRHVPASTSVEAYRLGMEAVIRGAGKKSFILGCNHAYWPSLGLLHGSRTSFDIMTGFKGISRVSRENLLRNWMNDRLWWNDPDCIKTSDLGRTGRDPSLVGADGKIQDARIATEDQIYFHLAATFASGGMMLSGDAVVDYSERQWSIFRKILSRTGIAAVFDDDRLETGRITHGGKIFIILLNWEDRKSKRKVKLDGKFSASDLWTGNELGTFDGCLELELPPTSGRVVVIEKPGRKSKTK